MRINFDYGGKDKLPADLIARVIHSVVDNITTTHPVYLGNANVYLNFYNTDGELVEIGNDQMQELNYIMRQTPFKHCGANTVLASRFYDQQAIQNMSAAEIDEYMRNNSPQAYLYSRFK